MGPVDLDLLVSVSIFFHHSCFENNILPWPLPLATCFNAVLGHESPVRAGWQLKAFQPTCELTQQKNGSEAQKLDRSKTPAQRQNHIMKWNPDSRCWVRVSEAVQFAMQFITIFPSRTLHWKLVNVNARRGRRRRSVGQPRMTCLWLPADSRLQTSIKF